MNAHMQLILSPSQWQLFCKGFWLRPVRTQTVKPAGNCASIPPSRSTYYQRQLTITLLPSLLLGKAQKCDHSA